MIRVFIIIIIAFAPSTTWTAQTLPNDGDDVIAPSARPQTLQTYVDYTESACFFRYQPFVTEEALANAADGYSQNLRYTGKCNTNRYWTNMGERFVAVESGSEMKVREYWTVHQAGTGDLVRVLQAVSNKPYIKCCPLRERWINT